MAKDPAMLWYWADWHSGTVTFSRHLKGCYIDLLHAQFNNGHLSLDEVKTVLGSDFGSSWPTIQKKFSVDPQGLYFNERLELEKEKRMAFTDSRKKNLKKSHMTTHIKSHMEHHMENGNENINLIGNRDKGVQGDLADWEDWGSQIVSGQDMYWEQMRGRKVDKPEMDEFISVAIRNKWGMKSAHEFRRTLNGWKSFGQKSEKQKAVLNL